MADAAIPPAGPEKLSWQYPPTFWFANGAELFERAAFYGMFITIFRYLTISVGFSDVEAGWITGTFAASLYFLPTFMGIMADKIGFKQALTLAFALLTVGYGLLGAYQAKSTAVIALGVIVVGGAIVKPVISGTVAKCSDSINRARAMSIFYMVVNIGSFLGKSVAAPLNEFFGLDKINFYAAAMAFCALILIVFFYRNPDAAGTGKTVRQALLGLVKVLGNVRFGVMILIIGGFWAIQGQLYASMPSYIERLLGVGYKPEWLANINPLVVVLLVVPITHLVRNFKPANAIGIGLAIIPFTALVVALGPVVTKLTGESINLWIVTLHPLVLVFIVGIAFQGVAECFLSPKWLEFASKQAPPGEVGLYLGYSHLTTFFAWLFGFVLAGYLLAGYCPDPKTLRPEVRHDWRLATDPGYRFALDNQLFGEVAAGAPVSAALQAAFAGHDLELPPEVQLEEDHPEGRWAVKTTDTWAIKLDGETKYQIKRVSYNVNDLPRDLVAQLEAEDHPKVLIEPAEGRQRAKLVEYVVISSRQRPRAEMPPVPAVYDRAHYLWYAFTLVGIVAFLALLVFKYVTDAFDARAAQARE
jgi:dipeptide/tripeptide permease